MRPSRFPLAVLALLGALTSCASPPPAGSSAEPEGPSAGEQPEEQLEAQPEEQPTQGEEGEPMSEIAEVRVLDAEGAPLAEAEAVVLSHDYPLLRGSAAAPLRADAEGRIRFGEGAPLPERALLLVWAPGSAAAHFEIPLRLPSGGAPAGGWEVRLPRPSPLRGRVTPRQGEGGAVRALWLQARWPEESPPGVDEAEPPWPYFVRLAVDGEGRFRAEGLAPGRYEVRSRPIGLAPVLAVDESGRGRFVATEPGPQGATPFRVRSRELVLGEPGGEQEIPAEIQVRFGRAPVVGQVVDEEGRPIAGAEVALSSEGPFHATVRTDARGRFEAETPPLSALRLAASHPGFGLQWTDYEWSGWSRYDAVPEEPVRLVLRRGAVLRGRLLDEEGQPVTGERLLMVPAYIGSGPATLRAQTDEEGRFAFERALLSHFELVSTSLDHWNPESRGRPGRFFRIEGEEEAWARSARAGEEVELRREAFELLRVPLRLRASGGEPLRRRQIDLWLRSAPDRYLGAVPRTDGEGRAQVLMERGQRYELWAQLFDPESTRVAPWTQGIEPLWSGQQSGAAGEEREISLDLPAPR